MATSFTLTLDTTAPADVAASINSGAGFATSHDVLLAATSSDSDLTGYTVKIWGDVDEAHNANIQTDEVDSTWITLASPHSVRLSTGDGAKTLHVKVRDDVHNVSAEATDSITLDTSAPVPNVTAGPSPEKISKQATKDTSSFTWSADADFVEYKVKVVPATDSLHSAGTQIDTTNGSTNMSGSGAFEADDPITSEINGADLEAAGAEGDNVVKIFVRDEAGNWSL